MKHAQGATATVWRRQQQAVERWRSPTQAASGAAKRWHQAKAQTMAQAPEAAATATIRRRQQRAVERGRSPTQPPSRAEDEILLFHQQLRQQHQQQHTTTGAILCAILDGVQSGSVLHQQQSPPLLHTICTCTMYRVPVFRDKL